MSSDQKLRFLTSQAPDEWVPSCPEPGFFLVAEDKCQLLVIWDVPRTTITTGAFEMNLELCLDRIINLVVGSLTSLLILVTLISAFVFPQLPPKPLNIFFAVCISLSSITACILIYWYRQGDLEPKFRNLIYYILFSIIMLCICANLYFHDVGKGHIH
eukprot:bmy_19463T0